MTATARAALFAFTFPTVDHKLQPFVVIDASREYANAKFSERKPAEGWVRMDLNSREIVGYNSDDNSEILGVRLPNFKGFFVAQFDCPLLSAGVCSNQQLADGSLEARGGRSGRLCSRRTACQRDDSCPNRHLFH